MSRSLFVSGLSRRTTIEDVESLFREYGRLKDVYIPRDYYTREPRGFAYIEYFDERDCEEAIRRGNFIVHGRELSVEFARGSRKTPREMRGKGSRHEVDRYNPPRRPWYPPPDRSYRPRRSSRSPNRHRNESRPDSRRHDDDTERHRNRSSSPHSRTLLSTTDHQKRSAKQNGHSSPTGSPPSTSPNAAAMPTAAAASAASVRSPPPSG